MIAFVKEAEALAERGQLEQLRGEEGEQAGRPGGLGWRLGAEAWLLLTP